MTSEMLESSAQGNVEEIKTLLDALEAPERIGGRAEVTPLPSLLVAAEPPAAAPPAAPTTAPTEEPPSGIPTEFFNLSGEGPDLAAIVAEMTALKQEVKLQGRTFKKLQETVQAFVGDPETGTAPPFFGRLAGALSEAVDAGFQQGVEQAAETLNEHRHEADGEVDEAREHGFLEAADALMDARDRLAFGLDQARATLAAFTGWRARLGGRDVLLAALQGQELALARLDDELKKMSFEPLARAGDAFDADQMRAAEAVAASGAPTGTILSVLRQGYSRNDETLRIAEVRVAK